MRLHEVIWPSQYIMIAFGLWPMRSDAGLARRLFARTRTLVAILGVISLLVPGVMTAKVHWGDIDIIGEVGSSLILQSMLTLKFVYFVLHRSSFRSIYEHIKDFWGVSDDQRERENYERLANAAKLVCIASIVAGLVTWLSFEVVASMSWLKSSREANSSLGYRLLPLELYYGFDTQSTPTYEILFVFQSISASYVAFGVVGIDCTAMVFMVHVSGQFRLISHRFRTIDWKVGEQDDVSLRAEIGKLIAYHQHVIRVTDELNTLLGPVIFCQIMSSGLQICFSGYALIEGENRGADYFKPLVFFVSMLMVLLLWCTPAELIIQDSTAISDTIYYDVPWFTLTPHLQRNLNFVIFRAQKGCHVTALYQVMSIRRITEVFNAAGSYMALLRSMKK